MDNKIKVLLISPLKGTIGGISKWTGHILQYYNTLSNNNLVELDQYYTYGKAIYNDTHKIKRLFYGIKRYLPFLIRLNKKIKSFPYDVIHFTSSGSISLIKDFIAIRIAKKNSTKIVVHFRFGRIPQLFKNPNWESALIKKIINSSDKTIVIDKSSYDTLIKEGFKNIEFLPNPLSPEIKNIINNNKNLDRQQGLILFAGHVVKTKGVFELVKACKELSNIRVRIVGHASKEIKEELYKVAGKNNDWLEITGEKKTEEIIKEMLSCELFVFPSYTEGFPNVILESMACSCSIIASTVGAIPEMLNVGGQKPCGLCVEPKNVTQLKSTILNILDNKEVAIEFGKNAEKRVNEEYSMQTVWEKMINIWGSI